MTSPNDLEAVFEHFTNLRTTGQSREQALTEIQEDARALSPDNQRQLKAMLQNWEQQHESAKSDPFGTSPKPPDAWNQAVQQADEARKRNVIRRIQPREEDGAPQQATGPACPNCQKENQPDAVYCYSCGTPMGSAVTINATRPLDATETDNAYFGDGMVLFLKLQGTGQTLRIQPHQTEMIIGRHSPDSAMFPDVDLGPQQAEQHGVSRLHAGLRRQDNTLVLTDLGSKNHTHINGQRLHAHEVRVLHDGDELRLGRMVMYVYFGEG